MTRLTVVLPCYNEAERLPAMLRRCLEHFGDDVEILVVDDGSDDGTGAAAEAVAGGDPRVRVLSNQPNRGKGHAVRAGMLAARGERVAFTDADGSYSPADLDRVVSALDRAEVAIGARGAPERASGSRQVASRVFNRALRALLRLPFHDTQCGLKAFRRDAAKALFGRSRVDGFAFDAEVLLLADLAGIDVVEVPVAAVERDGSKVRLAVDAVRMLADTWRVRRAAARGTYTAD